VVLRNGFVHGNTLAGDSYPTTFTSLNGSAKDFATMVIENSTKRDGQNWAKTQNVEIPFNREKLDSVRLSRP
jgi:hypothetical protein